VFNANASSLAGELPIDASLPQVWVERDGDAERARALIEEFHRTSAHGPARLCPHCAEENPGTFETCWACGRSLD
jgi:hypothetical protein